MLYYVFSPFHQLKTEVKMPRISLKKLKEVESKIDELASKFIESNPEGEELTLYFNYCRACYYLYYFPFKFRNDTQFLEKISIVIKVRPSELRAFLTFVFFANALAQKRVHYNNTDTKDKIDSNAENYIKESKRVVQDAALYALFLKLPSVKTRDWFYKLAQKCFAVIENINLFSTIQTKKLQFRNFSEN